MVGKYPNQKEPQLPPYYLAVSVPFVYPHYFHNPEKCYILKAISNVVIFNYSSIPVIVNTLECDSTKRHFVQLKRVAFCATS